MVEKVIYINDNCHTGQLRDASHELLQKISYIVGNCKDNLQQIDPSLSSLVPPLKIKTALSSVSLSPRTKDSWNKYENWVVKLMVLAGVMSYPHRANVRIHEVLQPIPFPQTFTEAVAFLDENQFRVRGLLSDGLRRLDSLRWTAYAYTESRVLREVLFDGVCLAPPDKRFLVLREAK
ncbi:hypothetical protein HYU45_03635 [Candidatus Daviesbacteria bacterium]|nr:hypothetical protein [Candidatus Daviesbacteria bacterium]